MLLKLCNIEIPREGIVGVAMHVVAYLGFYSGVVQNNLGTVGAFAWRKNAARVCHAALGECSYENFLNVQFGAFWRIFC